MARRYRGRPAKAPRSTDAVVVNGYSERWLRQGFPWVYPKEVLARPARVEPGQSVRIRAESGALLGRGVWDSGWIAVRRFRHDDGPIDGPWLAHQLQLAAGLRDRLFDADTTAYRLVHGENDGLPGVRIDLYGHFAVLTLDSPSLLSLAEPLCDALDALCAPRGIFLAWRPDARDDFELAGAPRAPGLLRGHEPPGDVRVTERGVACLVRPGGGKDIGLFTDMREVRAWMAPHWGGRRVLNLFAHTGMFSVVAGLGGASEVVSVDLSSPALERAEENFRANGLDPSGHTFLAEDVRRALDRLRRRGERFDVVVLDPPGFSHGPAGPMSAAKDYPRLVAACLRVLEPDGWLLGALNVGEVSPKDFHGFVRDGARKVGVRLQHLVEGGQAPDHPAAVHFPEGRYLKCAVWRLIPD